MFRTQYDRVEVFTEEGCPVKTTYEGSYDNQGNVVLRSTGVINMYDKIQADKDSTDINLIIKRYVAGDTEALNRVQGTYIDTTMYPKTLMDSLNMTLKAEKDFNSLPAEIKEKFNNNFAQFIAEIGSDDFAKKLGRQDPVAPADIIKSSDKDVVE